MIVGVKSGVFEALGLAFAQHAERAADFHAHVRDLAHHLDHTVELRAVLHFAPSRAHAHARDAAGLRARGNFLHGFFLQQRLRRDVCFIARRLRAIGAVLRARAGLDGDELADLHLAGVVMLAENGGGAIDEIEQRQIVQRANLRASPVVANSVSHFSKAVLYGERPQENAQRA